MTDIQEWEQQLQQELNEIRRSSQQLAKAVSAVRGHGEMRGVAIEVNADGDITDLQIATGAMRWTNSQLTTAIVACHRKARTEARSKIKRLAAKADPRVRDQLQHLHNGRDRQEANIGPKTEEEIQAADDEYFERMNRGGWK
ncbi:YbaB/EbfC family nucleoid-associated protein [Nocardia sp. BMG51109]|uniref:YbaB/EbfC family nucleoid-associated protein n=1 Tax=Nocardia sp. BMG51109 TaxID=1056816 RepID=UPI000467E28A|nr:YbaB/EbfC family nucleoid-associated protein [Nocardia sp. BMG51109]